MRVASGRNVSGLMALSEIAGSRLTTVELSGETAKDARALCDATRSPIMLAFDIVGEGSSPSATLAALNSLPEIDDWC